MKTEEVHTLITLVQFRFLRTQNCFAHTMQDFYQFCACIASIFKNADCVCVFVCVCAAQGQFPREVYTEALFLWAHKTVAGVFSCTPVCLSLDPSDKNLLLL